MKYPDSLYPANVIRVIDGDTLVADVDLGFKMWMKNVTFRHTVWTLQRLEARKKQN
jgi:hypothetical protein